MFTGNGLRFHPIVRHHVPLSRVVAGLGGAPTPLALLVHPADDRSILLGQFHLTE
jgi:hypothetical protein